MYTPSIIESRGKAVTVTLLDANHCPGAVMFLFQVANRKILHVGDFRWNRDVMMQQPPLKAIASGKDRLDDLYLDTTYCNPKYTLPLQEEAIAETVAFVEKEMQKTSGNKRQRILHLFGAYTIGKERIYLSVAERFGWKVYVDSARFKILSALGWPEERMALFTTRQEEANLWVVPLGHINMKKIPEYFRTANNKPFGQPYTRIIGYRPTGWSMGKSPSSKILNTRSNGNITIVSVPYSEHSSFTELVDCIECLKPQKIVPTVNASKSQEQQTLLMNALHMRQTSLSFR
jgi:DNA cross-link repair 1A protein